MELDDLLERPVFALKKTEKEKALLDGLNSLTRHHTNACVPYGEILSAFGWRDRVASTLPELPFIPVRLFKELSLKSIEADAVVKTLTSSGTTSQRVSRIYLDKQTAAYQSRSLVRIVQHYLGKQRRPMLIVDTEAVLKDRSLFSARGAGIMGLSKFGRKHTYLLDEQMALDVALLNDFLEEHQGQPIFIFGFTFMIWQYLYKELVRLEKKVDLGNAVLIHSGGWKKLEQERVTNQEFKRRLSERTGLEQIVNFYGMVEQVGSIFMECEEGYLHTPSFADVIVRNPLGLEPLPLGEEGLIQVLSLLPHSYPGHSLITEDLGTIAGEDDCPCGKRGKYFLVKGRLPQAELRGCSDTHAFDKGQER
jgi:hypothetical protein